MGDIIEDENLIDEWCYFCEMYAPAFKVCMLCSPCEHYIESQKEEK